MRLLTLLMLAAPMAAQFSDTSGNVSSAASQMFLRGITTGCSPTTFCPTASILRQEAATFIVRGIYSAISGDPEDFTYTTSPAYFTDMPSTSPYYKYVQKMRDLGLTSGCQPNVFCASGTVTNGEMAVFVSRAMQIIAGQPAVGVPDCSPYGDHSPCSARNNFPNDFGSYRSWAHDYAEFVYAAGGYIPINDCQSQAYLSFCSDWAASRGQVALDIVGVAYAKTVLAYPAMDKMQITGPTAPLLQWNNGVAGQLNVYFYSAVNPIPVGTTVSVGCGGPGSTTVVNGGSPFLGQYHLYFVGPCKQVFFRFATPGGTGKDFAYYTPAAVGANLVLPDPIDTTPGIITSPPHTQARPITTTAEHIVVPLADGGTMLVPRGDLDYAGEVGYTYSRAGNEWRYEYELVTTKGVRSINLGTEVFADLTNPSPYGEHTRPAVKRPQIDSEEPSGWTRFFGTGWMLAGEEGVGRHFAMHSGRKPGLMPLFVQGNLWRQIQSSVTRSKEPPVEHHEDPRDSEAIRNAIHWLNNSTMRFVIGPAINADAGRGEVLVLVRQWVEDFGFELLRPLVGIEGDEAMASLATVMPTTQFERDVVACLKEALK